MFWTHFPYTKKTQKLLETTMDDVTLLWKKMVSRSIK
jgi:hypothetical protein